MKSETNENVKDGGNQKLNPTKIKSDKSAKMIKNQVNETSTLFSSSSFLRLTLILMILYILVIKTFSGDGETSDKFVSWAIRSGIQFPNMKVHNFPSGRGLIATGVIGKCTWRSGFCALGPENFLYIPQNVLVSADKVEKGSVLENILKKLHERQALVIFLLSEVEKGENSFWFPYLETLPATYDQISSWTDDNEISLLQNDDLFLELARAFRAQRRSEYAVVQQVFKQFNVKPPTFERFSWGSSVLDTRCFTVQSQTVLIPIADLMNHYVDCPASWRKEVIWEGVIESNVVFYYENFATVPKGKEVCNQYRSDLLTNFQTLRDYGYVQKDNPFNEETVSYLGKKYVIAKIPSWEFLKNMRKDTKEIVLDPTIRAKFQRYSSKRKRQEGRVFANCVQVLRTILSSFPTQLKADEQLLRNLPPSESRLEIALIYRIERKKFVEKELVFCDNMLSKELPCMTDFYLKYKTPRYYKLLASKNKLRTFMSTL